MFKKFCRNASNKVNQEEKKKGIKGNDESDIFGKEI